MPPPNVSTFHSPCHPWLAETNVTKKSTEQNYNVQKTTKTTAKMVIKIVIITTFFQSLHKGKKL